MRDDDDRPPSRPHPEHPRAEPEIIPPGRSHRGSSGDSRIFVAIDDRDGGRIYVARPGPFSIILALLLIGLVAAVILAVLLGLVLIWIPVVVILIAAAILSGSIRHYWRRWRGG